MKKVLRDTLRGIVLFGAIFFVSFNSMASGEQGLSTRTSATDVYAYYLSDEDVTDVSVQIGNQNCDTFVTTKAENSDVKIHTVILLDNSISVEKAFADGAKKVVGDIVKDHLMNEEFVFATISSGIDDKMVFSNDYDNLISKISNIQFAYQETYLSDIIYELLDDETWYKDGGLARIFIITDGSDDNAISYTNSEVNEILKEKNIPVYAIGMKYKNNETLLENLFAFSRSSGGKYFLVDDYKDVDSLYSDIKRCNDNIWVTKISPNSSLADGSQKRIKITINDGAELVFDASMPFSSMVSDETTDESEETAENIKEEQYVGDVLTIDNTKTEIIVEPSFFEKNKVGIIIVVIAVVLASAITTILIILKKKNDNNETEKSVKDTNSNNSIKTIINREEEPNEEKTEVVNYDWVNESSNNTCIIRRDTYVVLKNVNDMSIILKNCISREIVIGRSNDCDMVIPNDKSVSGKQCVVMKKNSTYYLKNLSSSNITKYNGEIVMEEIPVMNGGVITMGRSVYEISFEDDQWK